MDTASPGTASSESGANAREPVLSVVDRVSEFLFGLFMALTIVGAMSVAEAGRGEVRTLLIAALGCNLAWGLVDAVMYLVRTITERGRSLSLVHAVRAAEPQAGRVLIQQSLSRAASVLAADVDLEAIRRRIVALEDLPSRPRLQGRDLLAALAVFVMVVVSTFPVALPFLLISDVATAMSVSRSVALALLFLGGYALGRYAGYGGWRAGCLMMAIGAALVLAVMALGG
jgi:VIT1/CCC1 family predicted Fe2+/Mn2+ transporter